MYRGWKTYYFAGAILFNAVSVDVTAGELESASLFATSEATARVGSKLRWHGLSADAIIVQHDIVLDLAALRRGSKKYSSENLSRSRVSVGHIFEALLPEVGRPTRFQVEEVAEYVPGVVSYSGRAQYLENATFIISEKNGRVLGRIMLGQLSFIIEPSPTKINQHVLTVLDRALFLQDPNHPLRRSLKAELEDGGTVQAMGAGSGEVRVLFLFANDISNPSLMAANIVSEFNAALTRSGVASTNRFSSANVRVVSSSFSGSNDCKGKLLHDMHQRNGVFSSIDQWMASDFADMAHLVASTVEPFSAVLCPPGLPSGFDADSRIGGISTGFYPGDAGLSDPSSSPFAMTNSTYVLGDLTALHEIGHSLGGSHADATDGQGVQGFAYSSRAHGRENNNAGQWQTIMGGYTTSRCVFDASEADPASQPCERIAYFSNPDLTALVNGQTVVIGTNSNDGSNTPRDGGQRHADMETWLESTGMPIVSGYTQNPPAPSSAPTLSVIPGFCFGQSWVNWTSVTGASSYRLFRSFSPSFSAPSVIYDGSGNSTLVNIPGPPEPGTWYMRVKACNAGGCSGWSNQQSASWVNGCF